MVNNNDNHVRVSENFKELIKKIKEAENKRGNTTCSDPIATEILYQRIVKAGGLKEDI